MCPIKLERIEHPNVQLLIERDGVDPQHLDALRRRDHVC